MINATEVRSIVVNDPADPYGPPLIKYALRVRDRDTGRWWYVRTCSNRSGQPRYTFVGDMLGARLMSYRTARRHQANIPLDAMDH